MSFACAEALEVKKTLLRPVGNARVTQAFGVVSVTGVIHSGIDYGVVTGTPIKAAESFLVTYTEVGKNMPGLESDGSWGGYGTQVRGVHQDGNDSFNMRYGHLSRLDVYLNQNVKRGDIIGLSGETGIADGPHLHFQCNDTMDVPFDPEPWYGEPVEEDVPLPDNFDELWPYIQAVAVAAKRGSFTASEDTESQSDPESRAIRRLGELFAAVQLTEAQLANLPPTLRTVILDLTNAGLTHA